MMVARGRVYVQIACWAAVQLEHGQQDLESTANGCVFGLVSLFKPSMMQNECSPAGIVHTFHSGHWGNWMFTIASLDTSNSTIRFGKGGFQEARGADKGAEW